MNYKLYDTYEKYNLITQEGLRIHSRSNYLKSYIYTIFNFILFVCIVLLDFEAWKHNILNAARLRGSSLNTNN